MDNIKRVFLIVLDSCGIGEAPDAEKFGDKGCSTIRSISKSSEFNIDTLRSLGYTKIDALSFLGDGELKAQVARLKELSPRKRHNHRSLGNCRGYIRKTATHISQRFPRRFN